MAAAHRTFLQMPADVSILFLGKRDDENSVQAERFLRAHFATVTAACGEWGEALPAQVREWTGDYIVSYLSRWIIPAPVLKKASRAALNFHPAPPEYPGVGCLNFALYDGASFYGVTCHHMAPSVDTGRIIAVRRFPLLAGDDVALLLERTHQHLLTLFYEIVSEIAVSHSLPECAESWKRRPYTRMELDHLARIEPEMPREEVARRVRATAFGKWRPSVTVAGFRFELAGTDRLPTP
jgi:methionyl-tRNA formyltransferase